MSSKYQAQVDAFMTKVKASNPNETEFLQAVHEVAEAVIPYMEEHPKYKTAKILERIVEPERTLIFRVPWVDDKGEIQVNRGYRVVSNKFSKTLLLLSQWEAVKVVLTSIQKERAIVK
jgi:hypothetical protein